MLLELWCSYVAGGRRIELFHLHSAAGGKGKCCAILCMSKSREVTAGGVGGIHFGYGW